jgi:flagella synthesis protein FlgN
MLTMRLQEELATADTLLRLLQHEYEILKARDLPGLQQLVVEKQACADRLQSQIASRLDELHTLGCTADAQGMATWMKSLPPAEQVVASRLWVELEPVAERLRAQNQINGAVIAASRNHVEQSLAILRGRDSLDVLYDQGSRKVFSGGRRGGTIAKA